jgi:polysaccharide pyruvyl transferase WcaK-like protein/glycosyltransferase involved in cell wall biosynthesis
MVVVSVVVVAKNAGKTISRCIGSIERQVGIGRDDFEIILVNDGSTDDTVKIATKTCSRLVVINNPSSSISSNRNVGWRNAAGEYVAYIDADCEASDCWLSNLLLAMKKHNVDAVGGANSPPAGVSKFYDSLAIMLNTFIGSRDSLQGRIYNTVRRVEHLPGLNILIKKESLKKIGGYDEAFALVGEDEDLSRRLSYLGGELLYIPHAGVIHFQRDTKKTWSSNMFVYGKGRVWLIRRHPQAFSFLFFLPILALLFLPVYLCCMFLYSCQLVLRRQEVKKLWCVYALYICTHVPYALGMVYGLFVRGDTPEAVARSKTPKLFLMVLKNAGNKGDEAILVSCCEKLKEHISEKYQNNIYVLGLGASGVDVRLVPVNGDGMGAVAGSITAASDSARDVKFSSILSSQRLLCLMFMKARLLVCGGQWFHDLSRLNHIAICIFFMCVRLFSGRTGMLGVGVGPLRSFFSRFLLRLSFSNKTSVLVVRDLKSKELMVESGLTSTQEGSDLAFALKTVFSPILVGSKAVGICPCEWTSFENIYLRDPLVKKNTLLQWSRILSYLVQHGKKIILLPTMNPEDYEFCCELKALLHCDEVQLVDTKVIEPGELQSVVEKLELLVSMRLHPLIFSINTGGNFVGINYAEKVEQLAIQFESMDSLVDISEKDWGNDVVRKIEQKLIELDSVERRKVIRDLQVSRLDETYGLLDGWIG